MKKKAFTTKAESVSRKRKGKREYLNNSQTRQLMKQLNAFFEAIVEVPRIRIGKKQTIETLIAVGKHLQNVQKISVEDVKTIQGISGVGRYIVNSVSCFGFGKKVPLVDANISRIYGRLLGIKTKRDPCEDKDLWEIAKNLLPDDKVRQFNWSLIDLGSLICKPKNPNCEECPLLRLCAYAKSLGLNKK